MQCKARFYTGAEMALPMVVGAQLFHSRIFSKTTDDVDVSIKEDYVPL